MSHNKSLSLDDLGKVVPKEYFDPRFDSLKHVLNVLGAIDSEKQLAELRKWRGSVEQLVDGVVEAYYSGFNRSLQNYTQILRLFTQSRSQLEVLRHSLESSHRLLSLKSQHLRECYQTGLMLNDVCRLLSDVETVISVPKRVEGLAANGEWPLAVAALTEACNKLAREELSGIESLNQVRLKMIACRSTILSAIITELEQHMKVPQLLTSPTSHASDALAASTTHAGESLLSTMSLLHTLSLDANGKDVGGCRAKTFEMLTTPAPCSAASTTGGAGVVERRINRPHHSRLPSYGFGSDLAGSSGHLVDPHQRLQSLVDCIAQLGGINSALKTLHMHLPSHVKSAVAAALGSFPKQHQLGNAPADADQKGVVNALLKHVFKQCLHMFQSAVHVLSALGSAKTPKASAGLELLLQNEQSSVAATSDGSNTSTTNTTSAHAGNLQYYAAARAECEYAWSCLQTECQALMVTLFDASSRPRQMLHTAASGALGSTAAATPSWLTEIDGYDAFTNAAGSGGGSSKSTTKLNFSIEQEVASVITSATDGTEDILSVVKDDNDYRSALAAFSANPDLVTAAYTPAVNFIEAGEAILEGRKSSQLVQAPESGRQDSQEGKRKQSTLRLYLEDFLRMEYLPSVYVTSRARCSTALNFPEAFRPKPRVHNVKANVLPAALAAATITDDLMEEASDVPPLAAHVAGVLESCLGRFLAAFQEQIGIAGGDCASARLASSVALVQAMAREPAAVLLGSPVAFFTGRNADALDSFVSSAVAAGFGAHDRAQESVIWSYLVNERQVPGSALISVSGNVQRAVMIAALADGAEYIAGAIYRSTAASSATLADNVPTNTNSNFSSINPGSGASEHAAAAAEGWQQKISDRLKSWKQGSMRDSRGFVDGLLHVADRFRGLAGQCVRTLRLELFLLLIYSLELLPQLVTPGEGAAEIEERILGLARYLPRLKDEIQPYLTDEQFRYVFGSLATTAARFAVELLREFRAPLDVTCVARICRLLSTLQPALCAVCPQTDAARQIESAKYYFSLLTQPSDAVLSLARAKPRQYTAAAYMALLEVTVEGRRVTPDQRQKLQKIMNDTK